VQSLFILNPAGRSPHEETLALKDRQISLLLVRNPRARRYVLRLRPDGSARVTIPRGGSLSGARSFAERNIGWLENQLQRLAQRPVRLREWLVGTEILFRGETVRLELTSDQPHHIRFGTETVRVSDPSGDLRPAIERHLWTLAANELPPRTLELAKAHNVNILRISVRNQRSRWGSCSRRGTISLNWRLIQASSFVRDYIILHELMHLRELNHSARFWKHVETVCPDYQTAERWLKEHSALLR
jgi:predicted metal-dependent hydrolase